MTVRTDIRDIFRHNLRYYRLDKKLTQEELGEKSDSSEKYISDLERGLFSPSLEKLSDLAYALEIETYLLLKDDHSNEKLPSRLDEVTGTRKRKHK